MGTVESQLAAVRQRRQRRRRARLWWWGGAVLGVALAALAAWLWWWSDILVVRSVTVAGNETVSREAVIETAALPSGERIWRVDTDEAARRVEELPAVASAAVSRAWPSGISITVVERTPLFVLKRGPQHWWVDRDGVAFARVDGPRKGYMLVEGTAGEDGNLRHVSLVVASLPAELRRGTLAAPGPESMSIRLPDGVTVVWGSADQSDVKATVAVKLMKAVKARIYDVTSPSRPVTR